MKHVQRDDVVPFTAPMDEMDVLRVIVLGTNLGNCNREMWEIRIDTILFCKPVVVLCPVFGKWNYTIHIDKVIKQYTSYNSN